MLEIKNPKEHLKKVLSPYDLSDKQRFDKGTYIGGSTAKLVFEGDWQTAYDRIVNGGDNLSDKFNVQLGCLTEHLNLSWSAVINNWRSFKIPKDVIRHPDHKHIGALVDAIGLDEIGEFIVDAKHVRAFGLYTNNGQTSMEKTVEQYYWQGINNMLATGIHRFCLNVIDGNNINFQVFIPFDEDNANEYIKRSKEFWKHVETKTPPEDKFVDDAPNEIRSEYIDYDFHGNNAWANAAHDFLEKQKESKKFEGIKKFIKTLVPEDAGKVTGHGVTASRNAKGQISVRAAHGST